MTFSKKETEQLNNLFSFVDSLLRPLFKKISDTYTLVINKSNNGKICKFLIQENFNANTQEKIQRTIQNYQNSSIDENTKERQWKNISILLVKDKNKQDDYKNLEGKSVQIKKSYSTELIFHFNEYIFNQENIGNLIEVLKYLNVNCNEIKTKILIKLIIDYSNSFSSFVSDIQILLKNETIQEFKDILSIYLNEVDNNSNVLTVKKELEISVINEKEYYKKIFNFELDLPYKILEALKYSEKGSNSLKELNNIIHDIQKINYKTDFSFDVSFYVDYSVKTESIDIKAINSLILKGKLRTKEYNILANIANQQSIKSTELEEIKTFSFTPIDQCFNCSKKIDVDDYQYQCYWCKIAFCIQCVETKIENNTGRECYLHLKHNLLYFRSKNNSDLEELDEYKLGNNLFSTSVDSSLQNYHSASCNGCFRGFSENKNNQRYICVSCLPGMQRSGGFSDFCYQCIVKMREKNEFEMHRSNDHIDEKHVQLMIIHQVRDYYHY